ncbi:hypothetical protein SD78_1203 [Bacillus badius]|nr:hypothetical protein SD78_1203 [Bacillus badius]
MLHYLNPCTARVFLMSKNSEPNKNQQMGSDWGPIFLTLLFLV